MAMTHASLAPCADAFPSRGRSEWVERGGTPAPTGTATDVMAASLTVRNRVVRRGVSARGGPI